MKELLLLPPVKPKKFLLSSLQSAHPLITEPDVVKTANIAEA
jgi:hypothetical protein